MFRELWDCGLWVWVCVCVCVCCFGHVGPKGEQKTSRQDELLSLFRQILAQGGKGYPKINKNMKNEKTQTQTTIIIKNIFFEMQGENLKKRRARRLGVYRGSIQKNNKNVIYNIAQKKVEQIETVPISVEEMTFSKPVGPNGTVITMVS